MNERPLKASVVVVGGANIDIQGTSHDSFAAGDSNPGRITRMAGGVGRNVAENCVRLGLRVSLVTVFGKDAGGRYLREDCEKKHIDVGHSLVADVNTPSYLCLMDSDGSLVGAVADMDGMDMLTPGLLEERRRVFDAADIIVADANLPESALRFLAENYGRTARSAGKRSAPLLFLDTVSAAKAHKARGLSGEFDCAKPNRAEAAILADSGSDDPEEICLALDSGGAMPAELFMSLGEQGMYYRKSGSERGYVALPPPGLRPAVVSRSGAGDAACAALVWASAQGFPTREKAKYALVAAMLATASLAPVSGHLSEAVLRAQRLRLFPDEQ